MSMFTEQHQRPPDRALETPLASDRLISHLRWLWLVSILLLAWLALGEQLSVERVGGMALIVFALFLSHWKPPRAGRREVRAHAD